MNAYEIADELQETEPYYSTDYKLFDNAANMLRQQADRIAELEGEVSHLKHINKNWSISEGLALQRIAELEKQSEPYGWHCFEDDDDCLLVNGQNVNKPDGSWDKVIPLYTTPQTKPLSFDVMVELGKEVDAVWDVNINGSVWFPSVDAFESFCRLIEKRHGIK